MHLAEETRVAPLRMTGVAGALQKAEQWLGSIVATAAALLVLAEIVVLFSGVAARYVFQKPIIWTDELAGILFLWLAMLGAVYRFPTRRAHAHDGFRRNGPSAGPGISSTCWQLPHRSLSCPGAASGL